MSATILEASPGEAGAQGGRRRSSSGPSSTRFTGRGGNGEPLRKTPWGEIAWQLGGEKAFAAVAQHDEEGAAPGGDVIRAFLPDGPALILMDELLNYINRCRNHPKKLGAQFHNFLHNLSEEARSRKNLVLCVSIPASELEMTLEDQRDYDSIKKLLDRLGKAVIMSAETDHAEIIRRRLFDWSGLPDEAKKTAAAYAEWVPGPQAVGRRLRRRRPPGSGSRRTTRSTRRCSRSSSGSGRASPGFRRRAGYSGCWPSGSRTPTRGAIEGVHRDPLIGLGTAPLDDPYFRAALFEQLGNNDLEGPVTTDIAGKKDAHALRLDREADDAVKKSRLHQKVATTILFESNGGMTKAEATVPEIRLAVAEPDLDIANVESALEALGNSCYYLTADHNRYRFSMSPNLNKLLTDRRSGVSTRDIDERVKQVIQEAFKTRPTGLEWVPFPDKSGQVSDRPALTLVVMSPEQAHGDPGTRASCSTRSSASTASPGGRSRVP